MSLYSEPVNMLAILSSGTGSNVAFWRAKIKI